MSVANFDMDYVARVVAADLKVQLANKLMTGVDEALVEKRKELLAEILPLAKQIVEKAMVSHKFDVLSGETHLNVVVTLDGDKLRNERVRQLPRVD